MTILAKGVDVSGVQGAIDWAAAKADGVQFAILKATAGNTITDSRYYENVKGAKAAGVPIGAYHFFYGTNEAETQAEAEYFLSRVKGYTFEYPLVLDIEGEALSLPKERLASLIELFCTQVEKAGYYISVYASASPLNGVLNSEIMRQFDIWVAQWGDQVPVIPFPFGMWQYSNQGSVDGIPNRVDLNYAYLDYPSIMRRKGLNGFQKEGAAVAGTRMVLKGVPVFTTSTISASSGRLNGTYYLYDGILVNGRYRVTNLPSRVGKVPVGENVTGWVNQADVGL